MPTPSARFAKHPTLVAVGHAIRRARRERGVSQERLALDTQIDRSYMGAIERGEQNIGLMHLSKIAGALDISVTELVMDAGV